MGVVRWNGNFINKIRTQSLNRSNGSKIVGAARDDNRFIDRTNKRCDRVAGLQGKVAATKRFGNLKSKMSDAKQNVFRVADAKVDATNIRALSGNDAEMIIRNQPASLIAGNNPDEAQSHFTKSQRPGWRRRK